MLALLMAWLIFSVRFLCCSPRLSLHDAEQYSKFKWLRTLLLGMPDDLVLNISENPLVTVIGNNCCHMCSPCLLVLLVFFELLAEKGTSVAKLCCILQRMFPSIPSVPTHVSDVLEAKSAS